MYLKDFERLIKDEYSDWDRTYCPMKTTSHRISCSAIYPNEDDLGYDKQVSYSVIAIYIEAKLSIKWFLKKRDGTHMKGNGSSSVYITEQEFNNNIVR
jgi:hypothetical protein